mgnify:CR=1 FL=1
MTHINIPGSHWHDLEIKINNYTIKVTKDSVLDSLEPSKSLESLKNILKKKLKTLGEKFNQVVEKI